MSLGTAAAAGGTPDPRALEAELDQVRRRFGHLGAVEAKLGQGAMGGVYRIVREDRPYALKVLLPKTLSDDAAVKRFIQEGNLLAKLDHPNILKVHEVGTCGDWPFMLSELVDGGSVEELAARGAMAWDEALAICESVLEALAEVHKGKIYHRDIKPSNVLLTRDRVVKLADFGIAKAEGSDARKTTTGIILGTPAYIAPEVLKGRPADARSDLYAVGVLLFELVAGRLPWDVDDPNGFLAARLSQEEPPRLVTFAPTVPRTIDALVQTAMTDNPVDRYPTAGTFLKALRVTRDRLVTTHAKPTAGTARISSAQIEAPAMRVTASRLKRPVAALKLAGATEPPSRAGAYAAGIAAALGVLLVAGILIMRKPPEGHHTVQVAAGAHVDLSDDENRAIKLIATMLMTDPTGKGTEAPIHKIIARDAESAGRIFYALLTQFPGNRVVGNALIKTRSEMAVDAAIGALTDTGASEPDRLEAAAALHEITASKPPPAAPTLMLARLQAFLTAMPPGQRREIVRAAIETYGWERDPDAGEDVLRALEAAPGIADWGGGGIGFSDPDEVVTQALERIGNPIAKRRLQERSAKPAGRMDLRSLNPKKP